LRGEVQRRPNRKETHRGRRRQALTLHAQGLSAEVVELAVQQRILLVEIFQAALALDHIVLRAHVREGSWPDETKKEQAKAGNCEHHRQESDLEDALLLAPAGTR
jgi:hypothetical protein